MIISVLQNHSRSISSILSANFADFTLENTENRGFLGVLQNESKLCWSVSQLFLPILRSISSNNNPFFTKRIGDNSLLLKEGCRENLEVGSRFSSGWKGRCIILNSLPTQVGIKKEVVNPWIPGQVGNDNWVVSEPHGDPSLRSGRDKVLALIILFVFWYLGFIWNLDFAVRAIFGT